VLIPFFTAPGTRIFWSSGRWCVAVAAPTIMQALG
jgi:hypothetical protein